MSARSHLMAAAAAMAAIASLTAPAQSASLDNDTKENSASPRTDLQTRTGDLSSKLDKSNGVIHPEGRIDPGINKKAPPVGNMPVIKPPGSPGSGTDAEPK